MCIHLKIFGIRFCFLDLEGGSRKATLVVLLVIVISSLKIPTVS